MKALKTLSLSVLALSMFVACNKGDNGGGSTGTAPGTTPPVNAYGNQQQYGSADLQTQHIQAGVLTINGRQIRQDIVVNKSLQTVYGALSEEGRDSCLLSRNGENRFSVRGIRMTPNVESFVFTFDQSGNLTVLFRSAAGEARSIAPIQYRLDARSQSIQIAPFELRGQPSQEYVNMELQNGLRQQQYRDSKYGRPYDSRGRLDLAGSIDFNVEGGFSNSYENSIGNSGYNNGFVSGYVPGQTQNSSFGNQPQFSSNQLQTPTVHAGEFAIGFTKGLQARIIVNPMNRQNILEAKINRSSFQFVSVVSADTMRCRVISNAQINQVYLQ